MITSFADQFDGDVRRRLAAQFLKHPFGSLVNALRDHRVNRSAFGGAIAKRLKIAKDLAWDDNLDTHISIFRQVCVNVNGNPAALTLHAAFVSLAGLIHLETAQQLLPANFGKQKAVFRLGCGRSRGANSSER